MKQEEIENRFRAERHFLLEKIESRLNALNKMSRRYRNAEKSDLIYREIQLTRYIKNFTIHIDRGHFDKQFLNLMFESYNPTIDYRKMSRTINEFIIQMRHKYMKDNLKFSEGQGNMIQVAMGYKNGSIDKKLLIKICKENKWDYKFDKKRGVLITPKI